MKTLLALAALCCALNASAVPILQVTFGQNNWHVDLDYLPYENGNPVPYAYYSQGMYLNGIHTEYLEANGFHGALNIPMTPFVVGLNTIRVVFHDLQGVPTGVEATATFTIVEPTGPRPTENVPDAGSTVGLLTGAVLLLIGARHGLLRMSASST